MYVMIEQEMFLSVNFYGWYIIFSSSLNKQFKWVIRTFKTGSVKFTIKYLTA